MNHCLELLTVG